MFAVHSLRLHVRKVWRGQGERSLKTIDLSEPHLWYSNARTIRRNIICHVGGTNSGKTYTALTALAAAQNGVYCGPLRLLAWEVHETLLKKGVKCSLITGQERDYVEDGTHISCTVEMADLNTKFDVAVIDEAQLLGDESRGWAWTEAFLGLRAKEIHLCGSPAMLPIIRDLCKLTNDTISVNNYSRLTPLTVSAKSLRSYKKIQAGDCIVGFGRKLLYDIKNEIEVANPGLRCCVIYGGLPPDARKEQARLFSTPGSGYDVLVASDAIGMGLNLSIKRIIFSTLEKYDGRVKRKLYSSELKQIAGRAGRYGTQYEHGEVTCMTPEDLKYVRQGMQVLDDPVTKAGLFPTLDQLQLLSVLLDNKVTHRMIGKFWRDIIRQEWGDDENGNYADHRILNRLSASMMIERFGSISEFSRKLQLYLNGDLSSYNVEKGSASGSENGVKDDRRKNDNETSFKRNSDLKINSNDEMSLEEMDFIGTLKKDDNDANNRYDNNINDRNKNRNEYRSNRSDYKTINNDNDNSKNHNNNDNNHTNNNHNNDYDNYDNGNDNNTKKIQDINDIINGFSEELIIPEINFDEKDSVKNSTLIDDYEMLLNLSDPELEGVPKRKLYTLPLSKLFSLFHRSSDMGKNPNYFLCNLSQKQALADAIDMIDMPFESRYKFCMSPANADNRMQLARFCSFARGYAKREPVLLYDTVMDRSIPKTPAELLDVETLHQIFENYIWLSQRFPVEFLDTERAIAESKKCAELVEKALKLFVDNNAPVSKRKVKKEGREDNSGGPRIRIPNTVVPLRIPIIIENHVTGRSQ